MKISILGTNGFLSTAIGKYANEVGWTLEMYGISEPRGHAYDNFCKTNLMEDELDCSKLLDSDIIIYAIGAGIQSNLKEGCNTIYNLNVTAPVSICNKLTELDNKGIFVTFGSYFEIGETQEAKAFTEEDILSSTCKAPNDYTISKRMLSRFVESYKHTFTHWHFYIPTIYGAGENPLRLIPYTINAIRNGEELHFTAGDQVRQYIHVSEIPLLLDIAFQKGLSSGIYNIEGKETLTVQEIVRIIHKAMGANVPKNCFGNVKKVDERMKYLALSGEKLKNSIGFEPSIRLSETLMYY